MELRLEINGQPVTVRAGATVMEALQKLNIYVPHFCYHEKLSIAANCRMCMVDIEKAPKALPACATPATDGMVVHTESERAKKAQHGVMEFLLINHPLDCPICDQGGECQLQDLAVGYGISSSRYQEEKRVVFEKNLGPLVATDMTRCIHCTRCVRFGKEVAGIMELGMTGRGEHAEIMPFIESTVDSELSGNIIDLCPVGALTSKPFRYSARPWELINRTGVSTHDAWGSHLRVQIKEQTVKRVLPSRAPGIHEHWISDRDRFSYEGLTAADRALLPLSRDPGGKTLKELPWQNVLQKTAQQLQRICREHGSEHIGFFVSPRATAEEALLMRAIADGLGCWNIDSRLQQRDFSGGDISGFGIPLSSLKKVRHILFIGADPARELPLLAAYLRQNKKKKKLCSIAARSLSDQLPINEEIVTSPNTLRRHLERLLTLAGGKAPAQKPSQATAADLFATVETDDEQLARIIALLQKGESVIWLGDSARSAADYGKIVTLAQALADSVGGSIGTLADGGNGIGVRRAGAIAPATGLNTAAMLRANLRAVVMLRCEKPDFAEAALAKDMLHNADFTCAITSYSSNFTNCASTLLPAAEYTETAGTYVNGNGEVTHIAEPAVAPPGKARPAWKILRMLGEYLQLDNFTFNDLSTVSGWFADRPAEPPAAAAQAGDAADTVQDTASGGYTLYGGAPLYGGDALTRRAASLQKTRQGKIACCAALHPEDMQQENLSQNSKIIIRDSDGNEEETTVVADKQLARGVIRFYPKHLKALDKLTVIAVAEEKTA